MAMIIKIRILLCAQPAILRAWRWCGSWWTVTACGILDNNTNISRHHLTLPQRFTHKETGVALSAVVKA
jgi:hypothetical protein